MYNHIIDSLNVLYKYQFGFRHKHSTQQAIITLVNKITSSLDTGDLVIGVFRDLKKAFDTVDHTIRQNACIWHHGKHIEMVPQLPNK